MKLKDIAEIRTGLTLLRKKAEKFSDNKFAYKQLNLKCLDKNGEFYLENIDEFISEEKLHEKYFTQTGDILVRLREPVKAIYIDEEKKNLLIPSFFAVIKVKNKNEFLPEYIEAFINSNIGHRSLVKYITLGRISILKSIFLKDLEIKDLNMKKQKDLIKILNMKKQEIKLLERLKEEKIKFYKYIENSILKKEQK